ncbi:MAG: hypothetical protein CMI31_02960 [Opitutae bacterium]|nr:hypothetical protein [Opitutae bacterium]|tara:strand:+ start:343 stop:783 length:441 start_codon:yes stop_codon:yes gene_type:complete
MTSIDKSVEALFSGALHNYSDWPNPDVPTQSGVYAVWHEEELVWVGSAGGSLKSRFEKHAKGQRRGSEFLKAVYARLMFRKLGLEKAMQMAGETQLLVDVITAKFVKGHLAYQYLPTPNEQTAEVIANAICKGKTRHPKPFLNSAD